MARLLIAMICARSFSQHIFIVPQRTIRCKKLFKLIIDIKGGFIMKIKATINVSLSQRIVDEIMHYHQLQIIAKFKEPGKLFKTKVKKNILPIGMERDEFAKAANRLIESDEWLKREGDEIIRNYFKNKFEKAENYNEFSRLLSRIKEINKGEIEIEVEIQNKAPIR